MEMLEAALALLCALGVGSLLWLLFGLLVRPARGREPWVVLPGRGPGEDLEAGLRQLAWLRRAGLFRGEAVIWDAGLTPEGRAALLPLGEVLGRYEAQGQREAIAQARSALDRERERAEGEKLRMGRVYQALGLSGGAFLVILLL